MTIIGPLIRSVGAYFLQCSLRAQQLYTAVFNEYVSLIMDRGVAIEYFIEGTRSLTGRLLPPRGGMMAITLAAVLRYPSRPVLFLPVYILFEHIAESTAYILFLSNHEERHRVMSEP